MENFTSPTDELTLHSDPSISLSEPVPSTASHTLDGLKRARAIKAEISTSLTMLQPKKYEFYRHDIGVAFLRDIAAPVRVLRPLMLL